MFITFGGFAQNTEGIVSYTITHNWIKKIKPLNYLSKIKRESYEYRYANIAEWKVKKLLYFNESESRYIDSDEKAENEGGYAWRTEKYDIRKKYGSKSQYDIIEMLGKVYLIEDSLPSMQWKIKNDIREIAGHICMNAIREDSLKRQKIEAWFALDIPVPAGPERNYGLPGLILMLDVNDGAMFIEANSVRFEKLKPEMMAYPKKLKAKKITEAEYIAIITKQINEQIKAEDYMYNGIPY